MQALFVTLDPQRDTKELLAGLCRFLPRRTLSALTGDETAIQRAAHAYKVYFKKVPGQDDDDYGVDHCAYIYLMDRDGKFIGVFPPSTPADRIVDVLKPLIGGADSGDRAGHEHWTYPITLSMYFAPPISQASCCPNQR